MAITVIIDIICVMRIMTIFRIIMCFQGWYKGTIERLGSSVGHSRSREQEQYTSIPYWLWRHNESSIIDAGWPNHDGVHSMTSIEPFCPKWIAVNPLHTLVLGVIQDQTVEQCKMALASGRFLQLQKLYVIICIKRIMRIIVNGIKNIFKYFLDEWLIPP